MWATDELLHVPVSASAFVEQQKFFGASHFAPGHIVATGSDTWVESTALFVDGGLPSDERRNASAVSKGAEDEDMRAHVLVGFHLLERPGDVAATHCADAHDPQGPNPRNFVSSNAHQVRGADGCATQRAVHGLLLSEAIVNVAVDARVAEEVCTGRAAADCTVEANGAL